MEAYRLVGGALFGTANRLLRRPEEAEEVVQETFVRFYQNVLKIRSGNLRSWLHRVTVNQCLDRLKAKGRDSDELSEEMPGHDPALHPSQRLDLARAVGSLPEQARRVFLLHDLEGFKHREVAECLGISEGTSKSQLFRARELLRERLTANAEVGA